MWTGRTGRPPSDYTIQRSLRSSFRQLELTCCIHVVKTFRFWKVAWALQRGKKPRSLVGYQQFRGDNRHG